MPVLSGSEKTEPEQSGFFHVIRLQKSAFFPTQPFEITVQSAVQGEGMHKIVVSRTGGPEELVFDEVSEPDAKEDEVLIAVEAIGINYVDIYYRKGYYPLPLPFTPGNEGVGRIKAVGAGVTDFAIGDRIAWVNVIGSYAELLVAPADRVFPLPNDLTIDQGMLFQAITAHFLLTEYRTPKSSDVVLVHAAAGGVGQLLIQWCKHLGATVIATASSEQKCALALSLGADHVIDYSTQNFLDQSTRLTAGRGVDIIYDSVGKATLLQSLDAVANRGIIISFGSASGAPPAINPETLIAKSVQVAGGTIYEFTKSSAELRARVAAVLIGIREGWLRIGKSTSYPLSESDRAHRALEGRTTVGKLILTT
jgi:NADPH2:quinone reductase